MFDPPPFMKPLEVQPHVELRVLEESHTGDLFRVIDRHRSYLRQWLPWVDATIDADQVLAFIRSSRAQLQARSGFNLGVFVDDRVCGCIGLHYVRWDIRCTEIGYWLSPDVQRRGIMTAAAARVTRHCFEDLGLNRVEIRCHTENQPSRRIPERLYFVQEGILRQVAILNGQFVDHAVYGMLAGDWRLLAGR